MKKKTKYLVDCFRYYATCIEVEATSKSEAGQIAYDMVRDGKVDPSDFNMTDDIDTEVVGFVDKSGERHFN